MPKSQSPKISIIIPIYNTAPYLSKTLESVIDQTYHNLEIILIDDGSTDTSPDIAQSFAARDPRIIYLRQPNSGVSSARNRGLSLATGELISFVDSDDTADPKLIEHLHDILAKHAAGLSTTTFKRGSSLNSTLSTESALKQLFLEQNVTFHLWGKLFKRELWDNITFPDGHIYEDVAVLAHIFARCSKIAVSSKHLYSYNHRKGSYVSSPKASQFSDLFNFSKQNLKFIQDSYPALAPYAKKYIFTATRRTIQDLIRSKGHLTKSEKHTYLPRLKTYAAATLGVKETPATEKAIAALALINQNLPLPLLAVQARKPQSAHYD